jgi:hypothetical protein
VASVLRKNKLGHLPVEYDVAHDLCFVIHDLLVELLKSGSEGDFFRTSLEFDDDADRLALENSSDIFGWLSENRRVDQRAQVLVTRVFPAVLSDTLHCIYEALESSRKGKLNITYMLIRKPIQENLFLLESVVANRLDFADNLSTAPLKLRATKAGSMEVHAKRVEGVLEMVRETHRLNAAYIAQLRYEKCEDGFDGICNQAMHLFTEHPAIRTAPLNVNFIFSDMPEKLTQWAYLYSRLPYLLFYIYRIVEHIGAGFAPTSGDYIDDIERRISALIVLWWPSVSERYRCDHLEKFYAETEGWLRAHCDEARCRNPTGRDLYRMARCGALPGEAAINVRERAKMYESIASLNRAAVNDV